MKKLLSLSLVAISLLSLSACESVDRAIKGDKYIDEKLPKKKAKQLLKPMKKAFKKLSKLMLANFHN